MRMNDGLFLLNKNIIVLKVSDVFLIKQTAQLTANHFLYYDVN